MCLWFYIYPLGHGSTYKYIVIKIFTNLTKKQFITFILTLWTKSEKQHLKIFFGLISDKSKTMHFNKILITMSKATNTGIRSEDMQTANKHKKYSTSTNSHQENALLFCFLLLFILQVEANRTKL